jgi:hypothetical protein
MCYEIITAEQEIKASMENNITVKEKSGKFGGFYSEEESIRYGQPFTHLVIAACSIRRVW